MKVSQLLSIFAELKWGDAADREVKDITQDSRQVSSGSVFVAIRGNAGDGHQFLSTAIQKGAAALVVESDAAIPKDYLGAVVKVPSTRQALNLLAQKFYSNPADKLFCVGVTGTNGKTTVTYMVERILTEFGWPTGVMGTIDHHLGARKWPSSLTTPDPLTLQGRLKEFVEAGAQAAAFEVSSHALDQARVDGLPIAVGVFTNFTRDHLDYHRDMQSYFASKEKLFTDILGRKPGPAVAVLNADDPEVRKTRVREGVSTWWFGQGSGSDKQGSIECDFKFRILKQDMGGSLFHLSSPYGNSEFHLPCPGAHNVYNATAAIAVAVAAGVSLATSAKALSSFFGAPGRLEKVPNTRGVHAFVDYAHTDDALRTIGTMLKSLLESVNSDRRLITVFGCGGDRDRGKRPLMAKAAADTADVVILTSDNPRSEDPGKILEEIAKGIPEKWQGELFKEVDRKKALAIALQTAREGDVILVAGKGHEDYQIVGQERLEFSDVGELTKLFGSSNKN
jgi:UDP-N-acetylmuramoyl-L-alanyl-D-glutamate--2,6-diaminopimelate ligase